MSKVQNLVSHFDNLGVSISAELRQFLDLVWSHRKQIIETGPGSSGRLYNLYAKRPQFDNPATMGNVLSFLKKLEPLSRDPRGATGGCARGAG